MDGQRSSKIDGRAFKICYSCKTGIWHARFIIFSVYIDLCLDSSQYRKVSGVKVWCEVDVMTDGLTEVNCKPLQSEGVDAHHDQSLSIGRVSSNGSTTGLVGRISADPITFITLRKVTSESTDSSCVIASVSSWVSETWPIVFKAWTALNSLNSILNWATAEASVRERRLLAGPGTRAEPGVATVGTVCQVLRVSPKLGLAMVKEESMTNRKPGKRCQQWNWSSMRQWPTITAVGQGTFAFLRHRQN